MRGEGPSRIAANVLADHAYVIGKQIVEPPRKRRRVQNGPAEGVSGPSAEGVSGPSTHAQTQQAAVLRDAGDDESRLPLGQTVFASMLVTEPAFEPELHAPDAHMEDPPTLRRSTRHLRPVVELAAERWPNGANAIMESDDESESSSAGSDWDPEADGSEGDDVGALLDDDDVEDYLHRYLGLDDDTDEIPLSTLR